MITRKDFIDKCKDAGINSIEKYIKMIDKGLLKQIKLELVSDISVEISIWADLSSHMQELICDAYIKQGNWKKVTAITSSENGEKPGLTSFTFYF